MVALLFVAQVVSLILQASCGTYLVNFIISSSTRYSLGDLFRFDRSLFFGKKRRDQARPAARMDPRALSTGRISELISDHFRRSYCCL